MKDLLEKKPNTNFVKLVYISRTIFLLFITAFLSAGLLINSNVIWASKIGVCFFILGVLLLIISWMMPGVLLILKFPWYAQAWLRGINPFAYPTTPWEQLSNWEKASIYFASIILFIVMITAIYTFTIKIMNK